MGSVWRDASPRSKGWMVIAVKVAAAVALFFLAKGAPVAGTVGLLVFLAVVVKPAAAPSRR